MMTKLARKATRIIAKSSVRRGVSKAKRKANRLQRRKAKQALNEEKDLPRKPKPLLTERDVS